MFHLAKKIEQTLSEWSKKTIQLNQTKKAHSEVTRNIMYQAVIIHNLKNGY